MILCVTLNPCLDKTLTVPPWQPGDLVRGTAIREVVGGKGNNVARALRRLGRESRPVTFLGGAVGATCESRLRSDDGMEPLVIPTAAPTRVILTVRTDSSAEQTAFFDPDPAIEPTEAEAMHRGVEQALRGDIAALTLSGSSPSPATHELYSELIALARARRIPVFLDTYGSALDAIWGFWSTAMQLNRREAAAHLRKSTLSDDDAAELLQQWHRHGVVWGIITDGPRPAVIQFRERRYRAIPPHIEAINAIGSGDSLLAGLVDGWINQLEPESLIRHALGCAVANAMTWDAGAIDPAEAARWADEIRIEPMARGS
jgi:1-phosphofructokinase family hexose kinase